MPSSTVPTPADAIYRYVADRYRPAWEDAGEGLGEPQWRRDADGIFRNMARPYDEWDFRKRRQLGQLASWPAAEHAFHADERLSHQIGTMVRMTLASSTSGSHGGPTSPS
jgi:hypothetical protein